MKKNLLILLLVFCNQVFGQVVLKGGGSKEMKTFLASKTMFVLTENKNFDESLKAAVKKYWKITGYEFINENEVDARIEDKSFSFFIFHEFVSYAIISSPGRSTDISASGLSKNKVMHYSLLCGGKKSLEKYLEKDELGYATLDISADAYASAYRLEYIIKGVNDGIDVVTKNNISGGEDKVAELVLASFSEKATLLKQKTLLVADYMAQDNGPHIGVMVDIKALQSHGIKCEVKTPDQIKELVKSDDSKYCFITPTMISTRSRQTLKAAQGSLGSPNISLGSPNISGAVGGCVMFIFDLESKSIVYGTLCRKGISLEKKSMEELFSKMDGMK